MKVLEENVIWKFPVVPIYIRLKMTYDLKLHFGKVPKGLKNASNLGWRETLSLLRKQMKEKADE